MAIRFFDMFAGIGGFRSGLEAVGGFECIGHCEIDKKANTAYCAIYDTEGEYFCDDARKIDPKRMPDFDLICAGFPCQSFSVSGKRRGFSDMRGTLIFEVARIVGEKRPAFLLLENVPGLLSHDGGRTFETILSTFADLGYTLEWCVHNSKFFGVPQSRKRLYIVGYLGGRCVGEIFPLACGDGSDLKQLTGLSACIRSNDLMQALATGFQPDHQESIPYSIFTEPVFTDLIVLTYDELDIPIDFSGKLGANQIFVDEIRYPNAITHKEVSTFIFGNGTLDLEISTIQQSKEKVISMRTWNDEIPKLLDEQPSAQINSCRTFFVNPTGDMRQNDYLVDVVVNYLATGRISSATLEHVISYEKPVLKTHLKVETEPGSCQFVDRTFDLVQEARKQGDLPLLEKLLRYQQAEE